MSAHVDVRVGVWRRAAWLALWVIAGVAADANNASPPATDAALKQEEQAEPAAPATAHRMRLHAELARVFRADPLGSWLGATPTALATDDDFAREIDDAQQRGDLEGALRRAVQGLLALPPDAAFAERLGRAAAYLELHERSSGRAAENALAEALYGAMETFPPKDVMHQAGKLMRAGHLGLKRDFASARRLAEEVRRLPMLDRSVRGPAIALASAMAEAVGDHAAAAEGYEEFVSDGPVTASSCTLLLRAVFLRLHLDQHAEALCLIAAMAKLEPAVRRRATGAGQIERFIALQDSGHAEEYWQQWRRWWPAWAAAQQRAALPAPGPEAVVPLIADDAALALAMENAYAAGEGARFIQESRLAISAARWLPGYLDQVKRFPLERIASPPELAAAHREFLRAVSEMAQENPAEGRESRARQRPLATRLSAETDRAPRGEADKVRREAGL